MSEPRVVVRKEPPSVTGAYTEWVVDVDGQERSRWWDERAARQESERIQRAYFEAQDDMAWCVWQDGASS